jgi:hypothetical protein
MLSGTLNACVHFKHLRNSASGCFAIGLEGELQIGQLTLVWSAISIYSAGKDAVYTGACPLARH